MINGSTMIRLQGLVRGVARNAEWANKAVMDSAFELFKAKRISQDVYVELLFATPAQVLHLLLTYMMQPSHEPSKER